MFWWYTFTWLLWLTVHIFWSRSNYLFIRGLWKMVNIWFLFFFMKSLTLLTKNVFSMWCWLFQCFSVIAKSMIWHIGLQIYLMQTQNSNQGDIPINHINMPRFVLKSSLWIDRRYLSKRERMWSKKGVQNIRVVRRTDWPDTESVINHLANLFDTRKGSKPKTILMASPSSSVGTESTKLTLEFLLWVVISKGLILV